jgi:hypothetical protein
MRNCVNAPRSHTFTHKTSIHKHSHAKHVCECAACRTCTRLLSSGDSPSFRVPPISLRKPAPAAARPTAAMRLLLRLRLLLLWLLWLLLHRRPRQLRLRRLRPLLFLQLRLLCSWLSWDSARCYRPSKADALHEAKGRIRALIAARSPRPRLRAIEATVLLHRI